MKIVHSSLLRSTALLAGVLAVAGCHNQLPDEKSAVTDSLNNHDLSAVSVGQDRTKGVITLKGDVASDDAKKQAELLARQAAPDYIVANEIGIRPSGNQAQAAAVDSNLDKGIEDNFRAALKAHKNLDDQSIDFSVKNGTLMLTGSVKTGRQRKEAEKLAGEVPNVQQVVNEIEVNPKKHSTANS